METSLEIGAIAKSLAAAQTKMGGAFVASHEAKIPGKEGRQGYSYKYGDLSDALTALRSTLNSHGVAIVQSTGTVDRGVQITTMLVHESGQWVKSDPLLMPVSTNNAQAVGSAITYARRYQLLGMVGLAPEDDDGRDAHDNPPEQPKALRRRVERDAEPAEPDLGPRCRGKKGKPIADAVGDRSLRVADMLGKTSEAVYRSALRWASVDVGKYGEGHRLGPADLTIDDGLAVKAKLDAKLAELEAPSADAKALAGAMNYAGTRSACQGAYASLCKLAPEDFSPDGWKPEWAHWAGLDAWPDQPTQQHYNDALAGMRAALERIEAS